MKDKAFRRVLDERRQEREDLEARRATIVEQMKAKVDAAKAALATDDEARVKAALEKDPEWQSLYARCADLNTALEEQRKKTLGAVREKMSGGRKAASTKTISK